MKDIIIVWLSINIVIVTFLSLPNLETEVSSSLQQVFKLIIGFFISVIGYSITISKGHTINIFFIPVLMSCVFYYFRTHKTIRFKWAINRNRIKEILSILSVVNIIYVLNFLYIYDFNNNNLRIHNPDFIYYAKIAQYLGKTGLESFILSPHAKAIIPYHYFELWITSMFTIGKANHLTVLLLLTHPFFYILIFLLSRELFVEQSSFKRNILGIFILFVNCFFIPSLAQLNGFMEGNLIFFENVILHKKISAIYFYLLLLLVCYIRLRKEYFYILLVGLPVIYFSQFFACAGMILGIHLHSCLHSKKINIRFLSYHTFFLLGIILFYKLGGFSSSLSLNQFSQYLFYKRSLNIFAGTYLRFILLLFPFIIIYILKYRYFHVYHSELLTIMVLSVNCSLAAWALFQKEIDGHQLFVNFIIPLMNISIAILLIHLKLRWALLSFFILFSLHWKMYITKPPIPYFNTTLELSKDSSSVAFFKQTSKYNEAFSINPYASVPLAHIYLLNDQIKMYDMTITYVQPKDTKYYSVIELLKKTNEYDVYRNSFKNEGEIGFIKKYNINRIIFDKKESVPKEVLQKFKYYTTLDGCEIWKK